MKALNHQQYMESGTQGFLIAPILIESNFVHCVQDYTHSSFWGGHDGGVVFSTTSLWQIKFLFSVQFLNFWLTAKHLTILELIKKNQTWKGRWSEVKIMEPRKEAPKISSCLLVFFCTLYIKLSLGSFVLYRLKWFWLSWDTTGLSEYLSNTTHNVYY